MNLPTKLRIKSGDNLNLAITFFLLCLTVCSFADSHFAEAWTFEGPWRSAHTLDPLTLDIAGIFSSQMVHLRDYEEATQPWLTSLLLLGTSLTLFP